MVATLKAVGIGQLKPSDIPGLLAKKSPQAVPAMAPAWGLYLGYVYYPDKCLSMDYSE